MDFTIKQKEDTPNGWSFKVGLGDDDFQVEVDKAYWEKLTGGDIEPEELVKKSFTFLLDREPKAAIMREFNLKVINKYFSDYEDKISN